MANLCKTVEDLLKVVDLAIRAGDWNVDGACDPNPAIQALREALKQPDPDPVAYGHQNANITGKRWLSLQEKIPENDRYTWGGWKPLYMEPPQKVWVGLSNDEIMKPWFFSTRIEFAQWVEAELKDRNK